MLVDIARSVWAAPRAAPRAAPAPARVWRDWVLVAALIVTAGCEGATRAGVVWRPVVTVLAIALVVPLLWRRTHPLAVTAVVFGALIGLDLAALAAGRPTSVGLYTTVYVLLLPYAVLRWGSGREVVLGLGVVLTAYAIAIAGNFTGPTDAAVALLFTLFPAVLGACIRFWATARLRQRDQVRAREREQLARELHDTIAHHVSAIVIRAQAGRVLAGRNPAAAVEALQVIEAEGARTLAEMRVLVTSLRDRDEVALTPQPGLADLADLARPAGSAGSPPVEVHLSGQLDGLTAPLSAALYRIAQESVTNAVRHARHATRVVVRVAADDVCVRLTVHDDGEPGATSTGFGVVGMTERATLLGGTLQAGPSSGRGWVVTAVLPRTAVPPRAGTAAPR